MNIFKVLKHMKYGIFEVYEKLDGKLLLKFKIVPVDEDKGMVVKVEGELKDKFSEGIILQLPYKWDQIKEEEVVAVSEEGIVERKRLVKKEVKENE